MVICNRVEKEGSSESEDIVYLFDLVRLSDPYFFTVINYSPGTLEPGIAVKESGVVRLMVLSSDLPSWYFPIPRNEREKFEIQEMADGRWMGKIHNSYWIIDPERYALREAP